MSTPTATPEAPERGPTAPPSRESRIGATVLGEWTARVLLIVAGAGFLVGFVMPWFSLGAAASVSGLGLLTSQGEIVDLVTGPYRFLLFSVPLLGAGLLAGGITGRRFGGWFALAAGVIIIVGGLYTAIRTFLSATGLGMWIVVVSALLALAIGLLTLGRSRS